MIGEDLYAAHYLKIDGADYFLEKLFVFYLSRLLTNILIAYQMFISQDLTINMEMIFLIYNIQLPLI